MLSILRFWSHLLFFLFRLIGNPHIENGAALSLLSVSDRWRQQGKAEQHSSFPQQLTPAPPGGSLQVPAGFQWNYIPLEFPVLPRGFLPIGHSQGGTGGRSLLSTPGFSVEKTRLHVDVVVITTKSEHAGETHPKVHDSQYIQLFILLIIIRHISFDLCAHRIATEC